HLEVLGPDGNRVPYSGEFIDVILTADYMYQRVRPGETRVFHAALSWCFDLRTVGRYRVRLAFPNDRALWSFEPHPNARWDELMEREVEKMKKVVPPERVVTAPIVSTEVAFDVDRAGSDAGTWVEESVRRKG